MKNIYLILLLLVFTGVGQLIAQAGTVVSYDIESDTGDRRTGTMNFHAETNGKYHYNEALVSDTAFRVEYSDARKWAVVATVRSSSSVRAFNVFTGAEADGPNPPDLSNENYKPFLTGWTLHALTVVTPDPEVAVQVQNSLKCNSDTDGSLTATVSSGTAPFTYDWSTGDKIVNLNTTTHTISGLAAGTYSVTVTDANSKTVDTSIELKEPAKLVVAATATDVSCNGSFDGSATVTPSGGTEPYQYNWAVGATSASITFLDPGSYPVTVTDANGCTVEMSATVGEPAALALTTEATHVKCHGASTGTASVQVTGGTGEYTYAWTNDADACAGAPKLNGKCNPVISDQPTATGLAAGNYTVRVTDAMGCTQFAYVEITQPATAVSTVASVNANVTCNGGSNGSVSVVASGGTGDYTYLWSNGAVMDAAVDLAAGSYTVTVTDANGCTSIASATVTEPAPLSLDATVTNNVACFAGSTGGASVSVTNGTGTYAYLWSNGATTAEIANLSAGTYDVSVTNDKGCTATTKVEITQPEAAVTGKITVDSSVTCYGASNGGLTVVAEGGVGSYSYAWSDDAKTTADHISGVPGGTYTVRILDGNNCPALAFGSVAEPDSLIIDTVMIKDSGAGDGIAVAKVKGGTAPYTYAWDTDPVVKEPNLPGLTPGQYAVAVVDDNGCTAAATVTVTEVLPGENCTVAIGVDSLMGGPLDSVMTMTPVDNSAYGSVFVGEGLLAECYAAADSFYHPMFFRFTGDGNMYRLWTEAGDGERAIPNGDTRAMLVAGTCNSSQLVACSDDASEDDLNALLEFQTEAEVEYLLLVDAGSEAAMGEYSLRAAQFITTSVTELPESTVAVYPNPTAGQFRIDGVDVETVEVYDGYGRRVAEQTGRGAEVDIRDLPRGVYTLRILDGEQMTYSARVVKQ